MAVALVAVTWASAVPGQQVSLAVAPVAPLVLLMLLQHAGLLQKRCRLRHHVQPLDAVHLHQI